MNEEPTERIDPETFRRRRSDDEMTVRVPPGMPPQSWPGHPTVQRPVSPPPTVIARSAGLAAAPEQPTDRAPLPGRPGATTTTLLAAAVLILVSVGIGVYGRTHNATFFAFNLAGFSSGTAAKTWIASVAMLFALVQLVSALIMYGKLSARAPSWMGGLHRWSGRIAVLVSVPVAVHCLYALGFQTAQPRVLIHSVVGCLFYGAFVAKMLVLQRRASPSWLLPVLGGLVFTGLTVLWLTAAGWFFAIKGITF